MDELTPYDTGAVAEPKLWHRRQRSAVLGLMKTAPYNIGKVDFDNDEGGTVCTVRVEKIDGRYHAVIDSFDLDQTIVVKIEAR